MLPDEWVTQTGADFDVDSVYGICYEFYKSKGKYISNDEINQKKEQILKDYIEFLKKGKVTLDIKT